MVNNNLKDLVHYLHKHNLYEKFYYNYLQYHGRATSSCSETWLKMSIYCFIMDRKVSISTYINSAFPWADTEEDFRFWQAVQVDSQSKNHDDVEDIRNFMRKDKVDILLSGRN